MIKRHRFSIAWLGRSLVDRRWVSLNPIIENSYGELMARLGQLLFSKASSDSPPLRLLTAQPSAPAVTDSVQAPEVQQPGTRLPRCSSRPPFRAQPKGRKGLREDTRGAD